MNKFTAPVDDLDDVTRAGMLWNIDEIITAAANRIAIPTDAIDHLPAWRALLLVGVCLDAGAHLESGTPEQFRATALAMGQTRGGGWWRQALNLPDVKPAPAPRPRKPTNA